MLRDAPVGNDGLLQSLIEDICREEEIIERERRTAHRKPLARPVTVEMSDEKKVLAFSKNVSQLGMGLIVEEELPQGTIAKLTIHSLKDRPVHIRSELRWSQPFGKGWFLTGWKFIVVTRG